MQSGAAGVEPGMQQVYHERQFSIGRSVAVLN
jgi:hypothetical protein